MSMKPYPFTIKKRIELDIESPVDYDIYVSIPTRGEPRLSIGCQEHTLSKWLKDGEKIIADEMLPQYDKEDLDESVVFRVETAPVKDTEFWAKPDVLPEGAEWVPHVWGGGCVRTRVTDDERRAEVKKIVKRRLAAIRAGEAKAHRAMVTLPLLIAAIQDELKAAGL